MLDIIPHAKNSRGSPRQSRVVKIEWKLPARLRRPVRKQLQGWQRRAIVTATPKNKKRVGSVAPPPYAGGFVTAKKRQVEQIKPDRMSRRRMMPIHARVKLDASDKIVAPMQMSVSQPKKGRLKAGFRKLFSGNDNGKAVKRNLAVFVLGCVIFSSSVWHLRGAGRGLVVIDGVKAQAQMAYGSLAQAQTALADRDFSASGEAFGEAEQLLNQARQELDLALASSKNVLEVVDVTGTVRSGTSVLAAGEALTRAGQHFSRGVAFLSALDSPQIVEALGRAQPELQQARSALAEAEVAMQKVSRQRLPESAQREWGVMEEVVPKASLALGSFLNQTNVLFQVLGAARPQEYLIAFENNHEIRPTGGFVGSIALVNVDNGVVENINVQSVYDPDGQLKEFIAPPRPLEPIAPRWWLRDANWFVDFRLSAQKMALMFEKAGGPTVDGVIAMTPEVVRQLLEVVGPVEMPAYGVTVDADNFIPLTQDLVTYNYDREENKPKQFLADLTPVLLNKLFDTSANSAWDSLAVLSRVIAQKHLLMYFKDEELQSRVEMAGWGGRLPSAGNILHVNNANIGGHKSDQFMEQEIDMRTEVSRDGMAEAVVTVRRTHRGPEEALPYDYPPNENPAERDNVVWQRVMVPQGSSLLEAKGFASAVDVPREESLAEVPIGELVADPHVTEWESKQTRHESGTIIGEESGYTYFANWMVTPPGSTTVGLYRFRLPGKVEMPTALDLYKSQVLQLVKQPGDTRTEVRTEFRWPENTQIAQFVPSEGMTQTAKNVLVYRGKLVQDKLIGFVYEKI